MIPLTDLKRQHARIAEELEPLLLAFMRQQEFILGPAVERLEREIADYLGAAAAVGVSSASDGLVLALLDAGVRPGDEVITTPLTFVATAEAIVRVGATPVFADVEPAQLGLSASSVDAAISPRTRAIIAVHLFGHVGEIESLKSLCSRRNLILIEDAAQAFSARVGEKYAGTLGEYGVFSFFPAKVLGGAGDGGMVVCSPERANRLKQMRVHGHAGGGIFAQIGGNFRLDALQSVVVSTKLKHVDEFVSARTRAAEVYSAELAQLAPAIALPRVRLGTQSAWNNYVVRIKQPDEVARCLRERGIEAARYYHTPLHLQPCFQGRSRGALVPEAERASQELLALPLFPELTREEQAEVISAVVSGLSRQL